jgi:hypothetical protein
MSYGSFEAQFRRRDILITLAQSGDYTCNASLLRTMLRGRGYSVSTDQLQSDIAWLVEQSLAKSRDVGGLALVTAVARGVDVATGDAIVPGVARLEPEN